MRELSEVKDSLDMEVKQNFIDPLQNLHDKDLREIQVRAIRLLRLMQTLSLQAGLAQHCTQEGLPVHPHSCALLLLSIALIPLLTSLLNSLYTIFSPEGCPLI